MAQTRWWVRSGRTIVVGCLAALWLAPQARAAEWFAGARIGASAWRHYSLRAETTWLDEADRAGLAFGGYRIHRNFALAGALIDLGGLRARGNTLDGFGNPVPFEEQLRATGFSGLLMGILPLHGRLDLVGTFGAFHWRQKFSRQDRAGLVKLESRGNSPCYGLDIVYELTPASTWGVQAGWSTYIDVGDDRKTGHSNDVDLFTIGITRRFRR